jgi:DNA-binding NarL/FixJ family response regulator
VTRPIVLVTDADPAGVQLQGRRVDLQTLNNDVFEIDAVIVTATVSDDESAAAVLKAIQRGARVELRILLVEPFRSEFIDQLRRLADIQTDAPSALSDEHRALLDHLRQGGSLTAAARALHVSRRTVDRRLAEIKSIMRVATTAEALAVREPTRSPWM